MRSLGPIQASCLVVVAGLLAASLGSAQAPGADPVSRAELLREAAEKVKRVQRLLEQQTLGELLITQMRNFSWVTGGLGDNHIVITSEVGAASLLIMRDGKKRGRSPRIP